MTTSFPMSGDGSEAAGSFVSDLVTELAEHASMRVVAPGVADGRERWSPDIEIFRYAAPSRPLSTLKLWNPADAVRIFKVLAAGNRATREATSMGATTHVLALWALPSGAWARAASRVAGVRYSIWALGSDIWTWGKVPWVRRRLRGVLQDADGLFADGIALARDTRAIAGREVTFLPSSRAIAPTGDRAPAVAPPYRLLFLGRWHANKGVDLLLDALDLLDAGDWARIASVDIAGGGPMESQVRQRVAHMRALGLPVEASGFLDKAAAALAFERSDWLLIPSRIESIPVVYSDAMKLGRPVIAMPVGDLPALVRDAETGICAAGVSAPMFARAIRSALDCSPASFAMQLQAMAHRFSLREAIVPSILELVRIAGATPAAAPPRGA